MADWEDWLTGLSGGVSGIVKGIDQGMAPLSTWEGIRTKDLANDRYEIGNEDIDALQRTRMGDYVSDFYGDKIGAESTGYRQKIASGEVDIYGNEQKLALAEYLSDPNGAFQQGLKETGWTPGTPEYREWLAEAMSMYDPSGAAGAYDKMGIPGIENRNLNEQAALNYIQNYARQKDPGSRVQRMPDGTVVILDSNGEMTPVPGDMLVQAAAMINAKTPYDAISQGLKDEGNIQKLNIDLVKAMQSGQVTPAVAFKYMQDEGVRINQALTNVTRDLQGLENNKNVPMMSPEEQATHMQRIEQLRRQQEQLRNEAAQARQMLNLINRGGGGGGGGMRLPMNPITGMPMGGAPRGGGTSVNTPRFGRPPISDILSRASGVDTTQRDVSGGDRPAYPRRQTSPQDTGNRPIVRPPVQVFPGWMYGDDTAMPPSFSEGLSDAGPQDMDIAQVIAFLQAMGGARA